MFSRFFRWITTTINLFHQESSLHPQSKLLYLCPTTSHLWVGLVAQTLSYLWMFLFTNVEFLVSGAKDSSQGLHEQLCIMWSVSIDDDSHNCRQTCRNAGGAEYTQTVTLKRTYIIVAAFWVVILVPALCFVLDPQIIFWWGSTGPPLKIIISIASHTKIFHFFTQHQANVQDHVQPQPCQANTLNMVQYRRTEYSVLWVQFALVALYVLYHLFR